MAKTGHFDLLADLLKLEGAEEEKRLAEQSRRLGASAEKQGTALTSLVIRDENPALGGRVILTLAKRNQSFRLPWNRLSVGSPVLLTEAGVSDQRGWRVAVCGRNSQTIRSTFA